MERTRKSEISYDRERGQAWSAQTERAKSRGTLTSPLSLGKYLRVGKLCTLTSSISFAVASILAMTTSLLSLYFSPSSSQIGASCLQCPHQGASVENSRQQVMRVKLHLGNPEVILLHQLSALLCKGVTSPPKKKTIKQFWSSRITLSHFQGAGMRAGYGKSCDNTTDALRRQRTMSHLSLELDNHTTPWYICREKSGSTVNWSSLQRPLSFITYKMLTIVSTKQDHYFCKPTQYTTSAHVFLRYQKLMESNKRTGAPWNKPFMRIISLPLTKHACL